MIIPARDEEHNLPRLLTSLAGQQLADLEIIVADDGSTDQTRSVALGLGARVVFVPPRPSGWNGKTWACHVAARESTGSVLVFLDADTRLAPEGLLRIIGQLERRQGIVSVEPWHRAIRVHEQLSAVFNVVRLAAVGGGDGPPAGAFGPCLAIRRRDYQAMGGHAHPRVRGQILEHFVMGQLFAQQGGSVSCFRGEGVISFRMYSEGLTQLVEGWSKALLDGARGTPRAAALWINTWITGAVLSLMALVASLVGPTPWWIAGVTVYGISVLLLTLLLRRAGRFSWWVASLFPVPLISFFVITALAALRAIKGREVTWRGRTIPSHRRS